MSRVVAQAGPIDGPATLTFLFTDIEGSARRWEQQCAAMAAARADGSALNLDVGVKRALAGA